jgi:hypothetical protein
VIAGNALVNVNVTLVDPKGCGSLVLRSSGLAVRGADASVVEGAVGHAYLVWIGVSYYEVSQNTCNPNEIRPLTKVGYLIAVHLNEIN